MSDIVLNLWNYKNTYGTFKSVIISAYEMFVSEYGYYPERVSINFSLDYYKLFMEECFSLKESGQEIPNYSLEIHENTDCETGKKYPYIFLNFAGQRINIYYTIGPYGTKVDDMVLTGRKETFWI